MARPLRDNQEVRMRGDDRQPEVLFSYIRLEERVPVDHPLRPIREMVDTVLRELEGALRIAEATGEDTSVGNVKFTLVRAHGA